MGALLLLFAVAVGVARSEGEILYAGQRVIAIDLARARDDQATVAQIAASPVPSSGAERALMASALTDAYVAAERSGGARALALSRAAGSIDDTLAARPHWGEAWAIKAYIDMLRGGVDSAGAVNALARSYAEAPYLRSVADWRVRFGILRWSVLDPALRARILDEAIWLATVDGGKRAQLFALARDTGAYGPFMLRWRTLRHSARADQ